MLKQEKCSKFVSTYHQCGIARLICPNYFKLKSKNGVSQSRTIDHVSQVTSPEKLCSQTSKKISDCTPSHSQMNFDFPQIHFVFNDFAPTMQSQNFVLCG